MIVFFNRWIWDHENDLFTSVQPTFIAKGVYIYMYILYSKMADINPPAKAKVGSYPES